MNFNSNHSRDGTGDQCGKMQIVQTLSICSFLFALSRLSVMEPASGKDAVALKKLRPFIFVMERIQSRFRLPLTIKLS